MSIFKILRKKGSQSRSKQDRSGGFFLGLSLGVILFLSFLSVKNPDFIQNWIQSKSGQNVDSLDKSLNGEVCKVDRCVDGDTIIVFSKGKSERIRLIGVNTPETVKPNSPIEPFGPEASNYVKDQIRKADGYVTLQSDGDSADRYGRRLAMVYLGKGGKRLLNEELIREGLGKAELQYRYSDAMKDRFRQAEREAQEKQRGIWSRQK